MDRADHYNFTLTPDDRMAQLAEIQDLDVSNAPAANQQLWLAVKLLIAENIDLRRLLELRTEMGDSLTNAVPVTQAVYAESDTPVPTSPDVDYDFAEALTPDEDDLDESEEVPELAEGDE